MKYWYAVKVYDKLIDASPGHPVVEGPFDTYNEAKKDRATSGAPDMLRTAIFQANTKAEAKDIAERESFTRI
jgi:hypothetical protein